jgi:two-component system chemotaxis sensor kinase CheA
VSIFSDDHANELRDLFFESSQEILQALNEDALLLEKSPRDADIVRNLRRSVHTLKGDSAACGYSELSELAHAIEDVLTPEIAGRAGAALAELMLVAADAFDNLLAAYRGRLQPPSTAPILQLIEALRTPQDESSAPAPQFEWTEYERLLIAKNAVRGQQVFNLAITIDPNCPMRAAAVQLVRNVLQEVGTVLAMRPEEGNAVADVIEAALATHHPIEWVERKSKIPTVVSKVFAVALPEAASDAAGSADAQEPIDERAHDPLELPMQAPLEIPSGSSAARTADEPLAVVEPLAIAEAPAPGAHESTSQAAGSPPAAAVSAAPAAHDAAHEPQPEPDAQRPQLRDERPATATENVIRVDAARIDDVLDLVGELIIAKSMMQDLLAEMNRHIGNSPLRTRSSDVLLFQSQILNKLQRSVMKIRMVPVERIFRRLPRVVRDTAKQLGREVDIVIEGEHTDLDKSILDALSEPLMHLLRNAVDHGIEPPAERVAAGKPPEGTIRLNAFHQGNQVVIEISDDGRGIDLQRVIRKAIDRGIVTPEQAQRLSENEAMELIFHAGLSTASKVTQVSGRGVGMDIVRAVMDRLKGTVNVRSTPGQGTTFRLKMPLTLAIIKALLFHISGRLYAVPLGNVLEIVRAWENEVHSIDGQEVLRIREEVVPLIQLSRMHAGAVRPPKWFVVVVTLGERKAGLVVDQLMGEQELVIKALDESLISSELVSGASILGDGRVVPILSVANIVEKLGRGYSRHRAESARAEVSQ